MTSHQALLINPKPPILSSQIPHFHFQFHPHKHFTSRSLSLPLSLKKFQSLCTLHQDNVNPGSGSPSSSSSSRNSVPKSSENSAKDDVGIEKLPFFVFLNGLFVRTRNGFENFLLSERFSWLPFWRKEKRLEMLVSEADANPNDPIKQTALLVELNKHSPESVIKRFDQREYAVDSKGVVEYIRALIATDAIAEYLPDEQAGKPSTLSVLLQELKERASGNLDESFLSPGISERQPLHVIMVDQKASKQSSHFVQELISTILFTVAVGLMWVMGAAALQRYIGGLGGIGTPGVGSSSSYSSKDLNQEIAPEKVKLQFWFLSSFPFMVNDNIFCEWVESEEFVNRKRVKWDDQVATIWMRIHNEHISYL